MTREIGFTLATLGVALLLFVTEWAVGAVFLPFFLDLADGTGEPPSRYLVPLSFAAIPGGTPPGPGASCPSGR